MRVCESEKEEHIHHQIRGEVIRTADPPELGFCGSFQKKSHPRKYSCKHEDPQDKNYGRIETMRDHEHKQIKKSCKDACMI